MNIYKIYREKVISALDELVAEKFIPEDTSFDAVTAEPPRETAHGDISTNAAMVIAKAVARVQSPEFSNPRKIAEKIIAKLKELDAKHPHPNPLKQAGEGIIESAEIAGPGFINLRLKNDVWYGVLKTVLSEGNSFGNSDLGKNEPINVEYVSANPTGPMHIGHARGAVVGDVLAMIMLKAGYNVTKEYYINDAGAQVDKLAQSTYLRYKEALGEKIGEIPQGLYPGEYLKPVGESFAERYGREYLDKPESVWLPILRRHTLDSMMALIKSDLLGLGIQHDIFTSERTLVELGMVDKAIKSLEEKGLVYKGVLEPPKGKTPEDWEPREQTLFRSSQFGDDTDRPLRKSDGSATYFASDIAYHHDKISRGFNKMLMTLGADHSGYIKRLKAAVSALSNGKASVDILIYQLVNFLEGGVPMKMSKRAGTFTTVRDVVEAVGKDVVRFIMLTRKTDAILDFDLKKVTEQSKDNPVFYVQYAHARSSSVMRNAAKDAPEATKTALNNISDKNLALLNDPAELTLIKKIAEWPRIVESSATMLEPHRIAFYLMELAAIFHGLWNLGKDNIDLRFIVEDNTELTRARLALVKATAITIASGLNVMGVEPVTEM